MSVHWRLETGFVVNCIHKHLREYLPKKIKVGIVRDMVYNPLKEAKSYFLSAADNFISYAIHSLPWVPLFCLSYLELP